MLNVCRKKCKHLATRFHQNAELWGGLSRKVTKQFCAQHLNKEGPSLGDGSMSILNKEEEVRGNQVVLRSRALSSTDSTSTVRFCA